MAHDFHWSWTGHKIRGPRETPNEDILIPDIAMGLSMLCRFRGMTGKFYSVAEHSVLVARHFLLTGFPDLARLALLHDAHEAYTGDVVSPQKPHIQGWREYETAWERTMRARFNMPMEDTDPMWKEVQKIDHAIVHREAFHLFPTVPPWWEKSKDEIVHPKLIPAPLGHSEALSLFSAAALLLDVE